MRLVAGSTTTSHGLRPTTTVTTTAARPPSITVSVALKELVTYTRPVVGLTATADGPLPAGTVAISENVDASTTETVSSPSLAVYSRPALESSATPHGLAPTGWPWPGSEGVVAAEDGPGVGVVLATSEEEQPTIATTSSSNNQTGLTDIRESIAGPELPAAASGGRPPCPGPYSWQTLDGACVSRWLSSALCGQPPSS